MAQKLPRIFSGIQPTGIPHLGNYFGALAQWVELAKTRQIQEVADANGSTPQATNNAFHPTKYKITETDLIQRCDKPVYSIVDVHAYTSPATTFGQHLYECILDTTASLLALGLTPQNCIIFRQSDVLEHCYLASVLNNFVTSQRLARMIQYKEKTSSQTMRNMSVANGLLAYPVLQAADILLYKATRVPVGADQIQHIELTRDIGRSFNNKLNAKILTEPSALLSLSSESRRIKSLRDPSKKMSKSDPNKKAFIQIVDEPDVIKSRIKAAITDFQSRVYFDAEERPGISNLMRLHHLTTGETYAEIEEDARSLESAEYKMRLADILIEKFRPVREEYKRLRPESAHLESTLKQGCELARPLAVETITQVKRALGSNKFSNF